MTYSAAILGASGYTGAELVRLLAHHGALRPSILVADSSAGVALNTLYPHLGRHGQTTLAALEDARADLDRADVLFSCLPHGSSMSLLPALKSKIIVDLGADFRLQDPRDYDYWYQQPHQNPDALPSWSYGLPELFRSAIKKSRRIANPGCYATAITLALAPLVREKAIEGVICVDALSGLSGAGKATKATLHFSHAFEDVVAYKIGGHQHTAEIEQTLKQIGGKEVRISFTAHLVPATRGIYATCSAQLSSALSSADVLALFTEQYRNEAFVSVSEQPQGMKSVRGSNRAVITPTVDTRNNRVIVNAILDNLVKGASGQAIQNANIALGINEDEGLSEIGLYP